MKIIITGGSGMVGKNLIHFLNNNTNHNLLHPTSSELNLLNFNSVCDYIEKEKPETIIHCAGLVGGIQSNIELPYSFLSQNLIIGSNLIEASIFQLLQAL